MYLNKLLIPFRNIIKYQINVGQLLPGCDFDAATLVEFSKNCTGTAEFSAGIRQVNLKLTIDYCF